MSPSQSLPNQRWHIFPQQEELAARMAESNHLSPLINQLLINRGINTPETAKIFLDPESLDLPAPLTEFPDLAASVELLEMAIANQEKIAICGDYDADGMTSTALLLRCLRWLGAKVDYAIPSRMHEGYGINNRIIEDFHTEGVSLVLTVDNGISAYAPIARARELGLKVIVTDHHDIPQQLPPANAILNPKLLPENSLYRGVAGVGVAYILAVSLAQQLGQLNGGMIKPMLELFTLGTIADLAPLTGVNRRWVKRGLRQLPSSKIPGIQALIQVAGVNGGKITENPQIPIPNIQTTTTNSLKPDDIGFRLGPRINAIGRIGNPQIVIELLTTDDMAVAWDMAIQCEAINQQRQQMCEEIEQQAIALVEAEYLDSLQDDRVLVVVQPNWHHGVIGIVASRLVERYGVPVFIGTNEDEQHIRGSARGIPEFNIFEALEACHELLGKYGGHRAAGGFSLPTENLEKLRSRLSQFANQCLQPQHLKPLLKIDTQANLNQITRELYHQLNALEPCGIENPDPIFWTSGVKIISQKIVGKGHIKLTVAQIINHQQYEIQGIAWRWRDYFPLPQRLDIAYKMRENNFNGNTNIELELIGVRLGNLPPISSEKRETCQRAAFEFQQRQYSCGIFTNASHTEIRIKNSEGNVLVVEPGKQFGLLGKNREEAKEIDISLPIYNNIIQAAMTALHLE